jgi:ribosome maturation factor RimP
MIKDEIALLITPVITELGYEFWACEYLSQGRHSLLRIYIDKPGGIGLEDCEKVSKQVSAILDVEDPIQGNYSLEVSSPGIPRPLFYPEHYGQNIGKEVQLKLQKPIQGKRKLSGMIHSVNDYAMMLELANEQIEIPFTEIVKANLKDE